MSFVTIISFLKSHYINQKENDTETRDKVQTENKRKKM